MKEKMVEGSLEGAEFKAKAHIALEDVDEVFQQYADFVMEREAERVMLEDALFWSRFRGAEGKTFKVVGISRPVF